ncbi:hypothetical protein KFE94_00835 [bacterium SCSIO 12643]|nr:hypothetical protein KFE94_00835 [bacterium SCSIO 12643]
MDYSNIEVKDRKSFSELLFTFLLMLGCVNTSFSQSDQDSVNSTLSILKLIENESQDVDNDALTLMSGKVFSKSINHKYIRLSNFTGTYIHVYSEKDHYKSPILVVRIGNMSFVSDSIFDINGDQTIDLVIHWYPSSGCCLADIHDCYLYDSKTDTFSEKIEIPNPTFYPKKLKAFSMTYGPPGYTMYYEFMWCGSRLDTLRLFDWNDRTHGSLIITDYKTEQKSIMESMPQYLKILNGFEWFVAEIEIE